MKWLLLDADKEAMWNVNVVYAIGSMLKVMGQTDSNSTRPILSKFSFLSAMNGKNTSSKILRQRRRHSSIVPVQRLNLE